jgi:hypothetical protein
LWIVLETFLIDHIRHASIFGIANRIDQMSRFKMKFKLQGLEVEIEGAREDATLITKNLGGQISGMLQPVTQIINGATDAPQSPESIDPQIIDNSPKRSRKKRSPSAAPAGSKDESAALDFSTNPEKFGAPRQAWKTAEKAIWLIYVLHESEKGDQFSTRTIVETFNKHFKQSGTITTSNVTRDLGRLKANERPPAVGEDNTKDASAWFLTDEGRKRAQALIASALGGAE